MKSTQTRQRIKLWTCPKCGRQFKRHGQAHSCRFFSLENHFKGKPEGKHLYNKFKRAVKERVGAFKVESLECCIHFVNNYIFAAVLVFRNKIRIDFSLSRKLKSNRIAKSGLISANRFVYYVDISHENEIDEELLGWIQESYVEKISD